ncbi:MAG: formate dehydrogenase accessory sulfurtransferase FdhD [Myxococcaceae bacterium]
MPRVELPAVSFSFDGVQLPQPRDIAIETAVNVVYGDRPYAVMMATPNDVEDFAVGFTVTEGVAEFAQIRGVKVNELEAGLEAVVTLSVEAPVRERNVNGRTGCGLCGVASFDDMPRAEVVERTSTPVSLAAVKRALSSLEGAQPLNGRTRSVHAAAWCSADGAIEVLREDVGRHCALDKLIGARLRAGQGAGDGFLLLTSRCSYELVDKAVVYGARTIVCISAPTSYAIERAQVHDVTLLAVARHDGVLAFHGAERVRRV